MQVENYSKNTTQNSLYLREQLMKYVRHWKWFVLSVFVFLVLSKLYLRYTVPQYKAQTTILIKNEETGLASELSAFNDIGLFSGSKKKIEDEIEVLKSRALVEKTVKEGNFNISYFSEGRIRSTDTYGKKPLEVEFIQKDQIFYEKDTTLSINVLSKSRFQLLDAENNLKGEFSFGEKINSTNLGVFKVEKRLVADDGVGIREIDKGKIVVHIASLKNASSAFRSSINVAAINKNSNVIEISCIDQVRERAEDFIDLLVTIYNNEAIADKNLITEKTAKFINERLGIITEELGDVEKDAENYKKKNDITDLPTEAELYLKTGSEVEKGQLEIATQLRVVEMMEGYLSENKSSDVIPANIMPNDSQSSSLIGQYNELVITKNRILKSSTAENPSVIRLEEQINALKSGITQSLSKLKSSLQVKNRDAMRQEGKIEGRISQIPRLEREYRGIYRQQQIKEELYLYLFKKREETAISLVGTAPISKVVDKAYSSGLPVSPKPQLIYLAAFFLGLLLPSAIVYLWNFLDTKVKSRHDLEYLSVPFVGDVPHSDSNNEIIQSDSRTSSAEAIRIVRTNLEFILNDANNNQAKTIFLTSTVPKEGKTFITMNLAATIAISGKKVLLIGMDIRNPKLDEYVKLPSRGLTNYLSTNGADIHDYIVKQDGYECFDIIPAGVIPPNPAELLMSKKVELMFDELKKEYDYIIVDTAPVSLVTDTLLISKNADSFIYVVRANYLQKPMLKTLEVLHREKKLPNLCVLLNDTDTTNGYGYGYGYGVEVVSKPWYKRFFSSIPFLG